MKAYRVYLVGTNETYLITEKQKPQFERIMEEGGTSVVKIGDTAFRAREIKRISAVNVDLESCPEYFQKAIKSEKKDQPKTPGYRKLPTQWIVIDTKGHILATDVSRETTARITKQILSLGDPEDNLDRRFILAKTHYTYGNDGQKQYYCSLEQIPEAIKCFPNIEAPSSLIVRQIYRYGTRQLKI